MRLLPRLAIGVALAVLATGCGGSTVFTLEAGECFQDADDGDEEVTEVTEVETVDCDEPHDNEAFHTFELQGDEFPDETTLVAALEEECFGPAFEDYIGEPYETSEVEVFPITPTQESWEEADDREVVCVAWIPGERVEGSLQGSGR